VERADKTPAARPSRQPAADQAREIRPELPWVDDRPRAATERQLLGEIEGSRRVEAQSALLKGIVPGPRVGASGAPRQHRPGIVQRTEKGTLETPQNVKPERVEDTKLQLLNRYRGEAGLGVVVVKTTAVFATKPVPDVPPHPDAGGLLVDLGQKVGDADPKTPFTRRGSFWDAKDPNYRADFYGISEFNKDPEDPATVILAIARADVRETTIAQSARIDARWEASTDTLFTPPHPNVADIAQGSLADCGLLAALGSVVLANPDYVKGMMRDNGATVTVRLFDIEEEGADRPHTYEADPGRRKYRYVPRYVEVDKSRLVFNAKETFHDVYSGKPVESAPGSAALNKGALWVEIIEKAYIAAGYLSDSRQRAGAPEEILLGNIERGDPDIAYEHLTGRSSVASDVKAGPAGVAPAAAAPSDYAAAHLATFERIRAGIATGLVAASTEDSIEKVDKASATTSGHSGAEPTTEGLVGGHAYTVVSCEPREGPIGPGVKCWIVVRNPWGHYGRSYEPGVDKVPASTRDAQSRMELTDFVRHFKRIATGPRP
jgi:hypothetical protein